MDRLKSVKSLVHLANRIAKKSTDSDEELDFEDLFGNIADESSPDDEESESGEDMQDKELEDMESDEDSEDEQLEDDSEDEYLEKDVTLSGIEFSCNLELNIDATFVGKTSKAALMKKIKEELKNAIVSGMKMVSDDLGLDSASVKVRPIKLDCAVLNDEEEDQDMFGRVKTKSKSTVKESEEDESEEDESDEDEESEEDESDEDESDEDESDEDESDEDESDDDEDSEYDSYDYES